MEKLETRQGPLMMVVGGALLAPLIAWLGGGGSSRAALLVALCGVVAGLGLTMLVWPAAKAEGESARIWDKASWPQRILWIVGGVAGLVGALALLVLFDPKS